MNCYTEKDYYCEVFENGALREDLSRQFDTYREAFEYATKIGDELDAIKREYYAELLFFQVNVGKNTDSIVDKCCSCGNECRFSEGDWSSRMQGYVCNDCLNEIGDKD